MKVLLITHPEMDHLEAMTFAGLTQLLGNDNVVTYPFKKSYYGMVDNEYILDGGKLGFTSPYEAIEPRTGVPYCIDDIKREWDQFTLIIIGTIRTYGIRALQELKSVFSNKWWQPFVFVEGEDSFEIPWNLIEKFRPLAYFKREYRKDISIRYPNNINVQPPIIPCPCSAITENLPELKTKKEISVFSVFGQTHPLREKVINILYSMKIPESRLWLDNVFCNTSIATGRRDNLKGYLSNIANSKIAVCVRGHGMDTIRHWEIPMFDTLLFTHDNGQVRINPFEDRKTCVMFKNDLSDFKENLQYYLDNEEECRKIALAGREHLYKYHTCEKRAKYIIERTFELRK